MSRVNRVNVLEAFANPDFYESMDYYKPEQSDFFDLVRGLLPDGWTFHRNHGVWFECHPPIANSKPVPFQGWKLHVSSRLSEATDVLKAVVPVLRDNYVGFKFAVDRRILELMNSKQWVRQGSGKFITIYPPNDDQFMDLIEQLYRVTTNFRGPYILSDRPYKDSKTVFYRYGGMLPRLQVDVKGEQVPVLTSPTGDFVPDLRLPYFFVPNWAQDPFPPPSDSNMAQQKSEVTLKNERYLVKSALRYSNSGGVYIADDRNTGHEVVIKEARPFVESTEDSTSLLKKEHRLLAQIQHMKIAPEPLDFFQDWEHFFLVEEFIKGISLYTFTARNNVILRTVPKREHTEAFYKNFKIIFLQLADILDRLHECGIVFSDLSPSNLLLSPDTLKLSIIDFESAYQIGVDNPVQLFTRGFADPDQFAGKPSSFESDYFALGAIMHHFLWPVNEIFSINPRARYTFIDNATRDVGFPESVRLLITKLMDKLPDKRPTPGEVREVLQRNDQVSAPEIATDGPEANPRYKQDCSDIVRYILAVATYDRKDRLFPAAGAVLRTNPLSIAYGACGVAFAINRIQEQVPQEVTEWILAKKRSRDLYPPGLYLGLAGIAWTMLEIGLREEAEKTLKAAYDHPLLYDSFDVYYGTAGWGMASLRFFMETQDELYLEKARDAGNHLVRTRKEDERGIYWSVDNEVPLGYAHGASGVSLFLLYLYLATGAILFLDTGIKAQEFDINNGQNTDDSTIMSWRRVADRGNITYPYWIYGSAGVGTAAIRYYRLLRQEKYKVVLEKIYGDTNRKYSIFPGLFKGLAGKGEFLLDLYQFFNDVRYLDAAYRVATGISLFRIKKEEGLAFPGEGLTRISCDYGTGSAGIGHFLYRLTHEGAEGAFNLDRLFSEEGSSRRAVLKDARSLGSVSAECPQTSAR